MGNKYIGPSIFRSGILKTPEYVIEIPQLDPHYLIHPVGVYLWGCLVGTGIFKMEFPFFLFLVL